MKKERTLAYHNPELINEWHPTLNENKTPYNTTYGSGYKAWWILRYDDQNTGKTFDFIWQAAVYHRSAGEGCPYLAGKKVYTGFNDIATICPKLKGQVHPKKNDGLSATDILAFSNKKIWWLYPYNDPNTGKHFDFEWEASPASRIKNPGCPFLSSQRIWKGFNDLKTLFTDVAAEWCYKKNEKLRPEDFMPNSKKTVWWEYAYDDPETGKHFDFVWTAKITNRVQGDKCPFLSSNRVWTGFNDLATKRKDIFLEWNYKKNGKDFPETVALYSNKKRWWICRDCGCSWFASPAKRAYGQECACKKINNSA